jgi:hypothetical protein
LTVTASVTEFDAESTIVSAHDPGATGATVTPFCVELIAAVAVPVQPLTEYGGVPPEIVAFCDGADAVVKLSVFGDTLIAAAAAPTLTEMDTDNPVASATVNAQLPVPPGAIVIVLPETVPVAYEPQPVIEYGAVPPETVTFWAADVGVANVTVDALTASGAAVPTLIFAIMPASSCERMWQCSKNVPTIEGSVKSMSSVTEPGPLAEAAGTLTLSITYSCVCVTPLIATSAK